MPARADPSATAPREHDRQVLVVVAVAVADAAAVNDHAVVKQRAVAFRNRFHLLQHVRELLDVEGVDFADLLQLVAVVLVVRQ